MSRAETIRLDQFLKWCGLVETGGAAKIAIRSGSVTVNGEVETRRARQLDEGDRVAIANVVHVVDFDALREFE